MDSSSSSSLMLQIGGFGGEVAGSSSGSVRAETPPLAGRRKKRARPVTESRCQVEGCGANLSGGKLYHVRHRICVDHSKSPAVVVAGRRQRFCQQCSRFHDLGEFDGDKRSCRRRLAGHNQRRRKPAPNLATLIHYPVQFTAPSSYDGGLFTTGLAIDRPFSHFNTSKPTRTDGYDSFGGAATASPGLMPFSSNLQMPSLHPTSNILYGRQPYGYYVDPVGGDAGNLFGTSDSERVLSVFCQRDGTSHSTMLHPLTKCHW